MILKFYRLSAKPRRCCVAWFLHRNNAAAPQMKIQGRQGGLDGNTAPPAVPCNLSPLMRKRGMGV